METQASSSTRKRLVIVVGVAVAGLLVATTQRAPNVASQEDDLPRIASEDAPAIPDTETSSSVDRFPVTINRPVGPPRVAVDTRDILGNPVTVACATCHSMRAPNPANRTPTDLDDFHKGMTFTHGNLACFSCHNPEDYDTLRLADGTAVEYPEVMTLCAQCHGTKHRDYQHGAHGGMNGFWDLTRGPRIRNNCIDCHDPHVPKFPMMQPTFKPKDRFLDPAPAPMEGEHG